MYLRVLNVIKYIMPIMLIVTIFLFWNFNSLVLESKQLSNDSIKLITLSNEMLNNNDRLIKLMRQYIITQDNQVLTEYETILNDYESLDGKLDKMGEIGVSDIEQQSVDTILELLDMLEEIENSALKAIDSGNNELAVSIVFGDEYSSVDDDLGKYTKKLISDIQVRTNEEILNIHNQERILLILLTVWVIVSGIMTTIIIIFSVRKIFWYDKNLNNIIKKLISSVETIQLSSEQLNEISDNLASGSSRQAAAIEETSANMNETSSMVAQNAENTRIATQLAAETTKAGEETGENMKKLMESMSELKDSSGKVGRIVKTIDDIAFQTNLLAINATIEAARAGGDAGRSFSVVAQEVRNLALRSASAVTDTTDIIEKNISLTNSSRKATEQMINIITDDSRRIEQLNKLISEIHSASEAQANSVRQINSAIGQMEKVTQENASVAEENSASSNSMKDEINNLNEIITIAESLLTRKN